MDTIIHILNNILHFYSKLENLCISMQNEELIRNFLFIYLI